MDAGDAWNLLSNNNTIGVRNGKVQCFMRSDRQIECDAGDDTDDTVTLNHSEFLDRFKFSRFVEISTDQV